MPVVAGRLVEYFSASRSSIATWMDTVAISRKLNSDIREKSLFDEFLAVSTSLGLDSSNKTDVFLSKDQQQSFRSDLHARHSARIIEK